MRLYPKPISTAKRIRNLGDLLQMLWLLTSVSQRFFFLKAYRWPHKREKHVLNQIEACVHKSNYKRGRARYRKSLSNRGGVIGERMDHVVVHRLKQPHVENAMKALLPQLEAMMESRLSVSGKEKISTVNIFLDANHYALTRFYSGRRFYSRFSNFGKTPAVKTWRIAWGGFLVRKIPILKPVMLIQTKPDSTSFILYESIEHIVALSRFWKDLDLPEKEALIIRLGMFIGYMHRTGCIHGNLSWENILIDTGGKEPQVVFHHVENGEIHRRTPPKAALKDLLVFALGMKEVDPSPAAWNLFMRCYEKWSGQALSDDIQRILFPPPGPSRISD
jgi:tRNA A-37 threonylcarbamoyl transferase component Bud32